MTSIVKNKKQRFMIITCVIAIVMYLLWSTTTVYLAHTLGINYYAAKRAIDIISAAGNVAAIIGLIGAVTGAGIIGAGIVYTAKRIIRRYGKKYAISW